MKKKYREITVDGVKYTWAVKNNCDGDGSNFLKVWKDKKSIFEDKFNSFVISPKTVAEVIKCINNPMNIYFIDECDFVAALTEEDAIKHYCEQTGFSFEEIYNTLEELPINKWFETRLKFYDDDADGITTDFGEKTLVEIMYEITDELKDKLPVTLASIEQ